MLGCAARVGETLRQAACEQLDPPLPYRASPSQDGDRPDQPSQPRISRLEAADGLPLRLKRKPRSAPGCPTSTRNPAGRRSPWPNCCFLPGLN